MPVRVEIDPAQSVSAYLQQVQTQSIDMIRYEQTGLQYIQSLTAQTRAACNFQTLLIVQPQELQEDLFVSDSELGVWKCKEDTEAFATYALNLTCLLGKDSTVKIEAVFDESRIGRWEVVQLLERLSSIATQLASCANAETIADIDVLARSDYERIWSWNATVPPAIDRTIHSMVEEHAMARPDAPGISAWDGEFSYSEMNRLASRLATHLNSLGVGPEAVIPLCFEKSRWTAVAMLAVLKAGGAFAPMDPAQPIAHLRAVVKQTGAEMMLCSFDETPRWTGPDATIAAITLDSDWFTKHPETESTELLTGGKGDPASAAYVVFTSGSTGTPKGVIVTHGAFASAITHQAGVLGYLKATRTFDFASYAFDMAAEVAFFALCSGVCLCVPSDDARKGDVVGALKAHRVDHAKLTPSVSRTIDWRDMQHIKTLLLGGEEVRRDDVTGWGTQIYAINTYGPTECTPCTTIQPLKLTKKGHVSMGRPVGAVTWVTDAHDMNRLAPIGALGELFIEGPIVGRGYLREPEKTAAAFIDNPPWLSQGYAGHPGRKARLYKTGDLVRYDEDGSLVFVARKDTQAKIRGQRIELSEVERYTLAYVPGVSQAAAEIIVPGDDDANPMLAAFVVQEREDAESSSKGLTSSNVSHDTSSDVKRYAARVMTLDPEVEDVLAEQLPSYMIPSIFFVIDRMPVNTSGKTDRKKLKAIAASFTAKELIKMREDTSKPKVAPSTDAERTLQQIWARVLNLEPSTIGVNDSFFSLGGDSVTAMRVVALAHHEGRDVTVADIFRNPRLAALSRVARKTNEDLPDTLPPFSLLAEATAAESPEILRERCANACNVSPNLVLDAYPCTPLQEGLLALTFKSPEAYILCSTLELLESVDIDRFKDAWNQITRQLPILRTRIVQDGSLGLVQVVIDESIPWSEHDNLDVYLRKDSRLPMLLGQPLMRFGLVKETKTGKTTFVWTVHHALYDGHFITRVFDLLSCLYRGDSETPAMKDFNFFIRHVLEARSPTAHGYWTTALSGFSSEQFPAVSTRPRRHR